MPRFHTFGRDHLFALAAIAVVTLSLVLLARRHPGEARLRKALAVALLVLMAVSLVLSRHEGESWRTLAPLQLCDIALFVGAWALWTLRPLAAEVTYFWGAAGSVLAVLTPDLSFGFPAPIYFTYFALHGAVIVSAFLLPFGLGRVPRPGALWRVLLLTNLYAAVIAVVDVRFETNFLFLRAKPPSPTPFDWFGPWPWYLLVVEGVAVVLFAALSLPFVRDWRARGRPRGTSGG